MDAKQISKKLVGSDEERAVSPVIGVILMVAITVILAAVIAAFVLDLGDDMGSGSVDAAVSSDVSNDEKEVELSVTEMGNAEYFVLRGDVVDSPSSSDPDIEDDDGAKLNDLENTGDSVTISEGDSILDGSDGSVNIVAVDGDAESDIGTFEWEGW